MLSSDDPLSVAGETIADALAATSGLTLGSWQFHPTVPGNWEYPAGVVLPGRVSFDGSFALLQCEFTVEMVGPVLLDAATEAAFKADALRLARSLLSWQRPEGCPVRSLRVNALDDWFEWEFNDASRRLAVILSVTALVSDTTNI